MCENVNITSLRLNLPNAEVSIRCVRCHGSSSALLGQHNHSDVFPLFSTFLFLGQNKGRRDLRGFASCVPWGLHHKFDTGRACYHVTYAHLVAFADVHVPKIGLVRGLRCWRTVSVLFQAEL